MSNGSIDSGSDSGRNDSEDVDPGEPIAELAGFEHDVSINLMGRIRRAIGRRTTAAQVTSFALDMPFVVLKEFWIIVIELFNSKKTRKDAER
jgi:hypothetical protein